MNKHSKDKAIAGLAPLIENGAMALIVDEWLRIYLDIDDIINKDSGILEQVYAELFIMDKTVLTLTLTW